MLKKISLISLLFVLANCAANGNKAGPGFLLTETTDPVFYDNEVKGRKEGKACSTRVLGLVATGDASIDAAKADGRISKVASADTKHYNILGIYGTACTVVRGE